MLSLSVDKRTGEICKSQRGLLPQKLLRNKLRFGSRKRDKISKFGNFYLTKFLAGPPGPAAAAPKLAAPGRSEGLLDETEPGFRGKISITQVGGTLSIGAFFIGKRLCIQIVYPTGNLAGRHDSMHVFDYPGTVSITA